jgi:methionine sulfoxide reductase heme-binding subunit
MSAAMHASYAWWLASRSAGLLALMLVTLSVTLGLAMAARVIPVSLRRDAVRVHQHLALLALAFIAAHGLLLLPDPWLKPGLQGVAVPFAIAYRPAWTGIGILGGYLALVLGLSFYVRRRIGVRAWRRLHRLTVLVYASGLLHALGSGTDAAIPAVRLALLASCLPILFLLVLRLHRGRRRAAGARRRAPSLAPGPAVTSAPGESPRTERRAPARAAADGVPA